MKTKIKRHSRAVLAVVLTLCMLVSCMTVGIIATDAAKTADQRVGAKADDEALGDTTYYLYYRTDNNKSLDGMTVVQMEASNSSYSASFTMNTGTNFDLAIGTESSASSSLVASDWTKSSSGNLNFLNIENSGTTYFLVGSVSKKSTVTVTFTPSKTVSVSASDYDGGGGGSGGGGGGSNKVYFKNNVSWTNVYAYFYNSEGYWNSNGSGSATGNFISKVQMTYNSTYGVYEANIPTNGAIVCFLKDSQDGYGNFHITEGSYQTIDTSNPLFTPNTDSYSTINETKYYNGSWGALDTTHDVTFSVDSATKGSIDPSGTQAVSESLATTVTATAKTGYKFDSWTNGTGITQKTNTADGDNQTQTIITKSSGTYTVTANFSKNSYTLTKGAESNGTFTVTAGGNTITTTGSVLFDDTITVTCNPNTGYKVTTVTAGSNTGTEGEDNNSWTVKMPAADATLNVTFAKKDNSITASSNPVGGGTVWVASAADSNTALTNFKLGDTVWLRANANGAYDFSKFVVTYANGTTQEVTTNNSSITISADKFNTAANDGSISVVGYFTAKPTHTVTVKTNNVAYGTAIASVGAAYEGQSVTLTATENTGTFNKWTVTTGTMASVNNVTTNPLTFTMGSEDLVITANFNEYSSENTSEWYYNGYDNNANEMTTENTPVSETSMYAQRMIQAKINGVKYSYYHVSGRNTGNFNTHLFSISKNSPAGGGRWVFFETPNKSWDDGHGWKSDPDAQFYYSDMKIAQGWTALTFDKWTGNDNDSNKIWKIQIPYGARYVQFRGTANDDSNWPYTGYINLAEWFSGNNNCVYFNSSTTTGGEYRDYAYKQVGDTYPTGNFFEYMSGDSGIAYSNICSTGGFDNHNVNSVKGINNNTRNFNKPKGLGTSASDYYVLILYKNHNYTINGTATGSLTKDTVIWMPTLPAAVPDDTETVDIYAKNGTLRDSTFNRFTNLANTDIATDYFEYTEILDTGVYTYTSISDYNAVHTSKPISFSNDEPGYSSTYAMMTNVPIGAKIKLRTTLNSTVTANDGSFNNEPFKDTHYLKAYSFNGMTYEIHSANDTGVYEEIWTVRDVNTKSADGRTDLTKGGNTIEVTPIYYMKDNSNCKTFYIDGYDGTVQDSWGNLLCVYPYYEGKSNSANAFGGYPGQPMLFWGGKYQMEIPLTVDGTASGASVKGLTLHNGYWDLLHRDKDLRCDARNHAQTYDYDDFYKLYKEKNPDTIIFDFKYRDTYDNFADTGEKEANHKTYDSDDDYKVYDFAGDSGSEPAKGASDFSGTGKNGVELVTDYYGRQVDAFGTLITSNQSDYDSTGVQDKEILFVSTGFRDTYVGEYATLWAVYAPVSDMKGGDTSKEFIGYISSSMLYLNNWDRRLQYTGGDSTDPGRMSWTEFETTYKHLKDYYTGVPALISYEKEIWNDSKDKANRSDGKWYYSNKGDQISANIIIQYNSDATQSAAIVASKDRALYDTTKWTRESTYTAGVGGYNNVGDETKCAAYFTNTSPNLLGKVESGTQFADSTKNFTFRADAAGQYMFVNWVRYSNGKYYEITEKELAESVMSSNDTYIARFVKTSNGSLKVSHVVEQNGTYNGTGTPSVTVTVKTANDTQVFSQTSTDGTPIDISSYIQTKYSAYKIDISLTTTPSAETESFMKEIVSSSASYAPTTTTWNADKTSESPTGADTGAQTTTVNQFTVQSILTDKITNLRYVSHLMKPVYHYNYEIVYTYNSRFWGTQSYTQSGTATEDAFTGSKTTARLNTDFIVGKTPYEKNFRQEINWNYTDAAVTTGGVTAAAMENNTATLVSGTTYKMTAHVYSSNTVDDSVSAEFILPYYYNGKDQDYSAHVADVYKDKDDPHDENGHSNTTYLYDTSHESVTLTTQAYKLFTADDGIHGGSADIESKDLHLIEAAPYLMMDGSTEQTKIQYHYMPTNSKRYYTGNSFTVDGITYYLRAKPDGSAAGANEVIITDAAVRAGQYTVTFTKRGKTTPTTYRYAVDSGTKGTLGYKVYFFAYNMNGSEQMTDNAGNVISETDFMNGTKDPVFNGQYIVYTETQEKDGIIAGTGVKKYFTRWDIYNTKGDFVASAYNRRFNYSGYDNYVVRPIYESDTEQNYATSLGATSSGAAIGSSITYLDDSRNQWNNNGGANYASVTNSSALWAADKLFTDFAITYCYNGENINTISPYDSETGTGADIKIGMVIERLDGLEFVGTTKITSASYYADKYKTDTDWLRLASALASGSGLTTAVRNNDEENNHTCYNSKIGANVSGFGTQFGNTAPGATSGQESVIDNFNRLQWFYTINNSTQRGENTTATVTEMKNYAYRAISYMIVSDNTGTHAYLCDSPAYFTIYDTASRTSN